MPGEVEVEVESMPAEALTHLDVRCESPLHPLVNLISDALTVRKTAEYSRTCSNGTLATPID